jgi:hypothetical protein
MVTPEVPTGCLVRQSILGNEADGHAHDAMGVVSLGCGKVGHVGVEILAALAALVLRVGEMNFTRPTTDKVAEVVQFSREKFLAAAAFAAARARPRGKIPTAFNDFGFGQILRIGDSFRGIRQIFAGAEHDKVLHDQDFLTQRLPYSTQIVMIDRW